MAWTVPPTNANTANAIVKRDASGNFTANSITANGQLFALADTGNGAAIEASSPSPVATVIYGGANSSTGATWGVEGETFSNDPGTSGVTGRTHGGGTGVTGLAGPNGNSFYADSNAQQARTMGGWVKAMVFVSGLNSGAIASCFNSTLTGASATTPPCGFVLDKIGTGDYIIDFAFQVDDRFFSFANTESFSNYGYGLCTDAIGLTCNNNPTANQVEITSFCNNAFCDTKFYLNVY
jgi:hypothetical protein